MVRDLSGKTGEDLERLCLRGPERKLMRAAFVQPLLTTICLGYWRRLTAAGLRADLVAGHSLGEIAALAATGVLTDEQAVLLSLERGRLMDEAADRAPGGMAAVFLPLDEVEAHIQRLGMTGSVFVANDNAPKQVVVSARTAELETFMRGMEPGLCKLLRVSGPWHTPHLEEARGRFQEWLAGVTFAEPVLPFLSNAKGAIETMPEECRASVSRQLTQRVRWRDTMGELRSRGVEVLLEVGPQRVLAGLARLNGFGEATMVRGVDSLRAVDLVCADLEAVGLLSRLVAGSSGVAGGTAGGRP
jgi:[acyl-carrier-protein] S-malonyltransferase